jgi:hypothetical protein
MADNAPAGDPSDAVDPHVFDIVNPPWAVAETSRVDPATGRGAGWAGFTVGEKRVIILFTDRDLAERFIERLARPNLAPCQFGTPRDYLRWLEEMAKHGYTHIGFDHEPNRARLLPLARVLAEVRAQVPPEQEKSP